ncbi:MAG: peptide chain release factor 2, partial [Holosporales bacterium]|nr:peptide chain release factor 2 [Holosporales bacterium]
RHTSFASVLVSPEINDTIKIEISDSDLRIDVYRASGAGGQHVNKTESAVRITHIPSGIVASSQIDRSQHRNKEIAMNMLKSKLYAKKLKEQEEALSASQNKADISWGNQIRSYVLQPYQMVKDTRTGVEKGNTAAVLDGEISEFLEAAISKL